MNNKKIGKETDEEVLIQTALSKYGRRAYDTSIAEGHCVSVLRGKSILLLDSSGIIKKIATVKQAKTKITQRKFSLKK